VCEGWKRWAGAVTGSDVLIDREEKLLERVGKPLRVTARVARARTRVWCQQNRVAFQEPILGAAPADPEGICTITVPRERGVGPRDLEDDPVLSAGVRLRYMKDAPRLVIPAEQHRSVVVRDHVDLARGNTLLSAGKGVHRSQGALALGMKGGQVGVYRADGF